MADPISNKTSGDGKQLHVGDKVWVLSDNKSGYAGAIDELTVTDAACRSEGYINVKNDRGDTCVHSSYTYLDVGTAMKLLTEGKANALKEKLSIHESD